MRIGSIPALGVCLMLLVTACAKKQTPPPAERTEPPPPAPMGVTITSVDLGTSLNADKTIAVKADVFKPADTLYASVATSGAGTASVRAVWIYDAGTIVDDSSQSISPTGPAQTEFHVSKPDGWPVGKYRVEVSVDGGAATVKEFQVQ
jgi:hypothetical protein